MNLPSLISNTLFHLETRFDHVSGSCKKRKSERERDFFDGSKPTEVEAAPSYPLLLLVDVVISDVIATRVIIGRGPSIVIENSSAVLTFLNRSLVRSRDCKTVYSQLTSQGERYGEFDVSFDASRYNFAVLSSR